MEQANVEHQNRLAEMKHDETMRQQRVELEAELDAQRRRTELTVEERRAANAEQLNLWQQMRTMEVDLTRYLVAQYQNPDRLIRIAGEAGNAQLHLHEN